MDKVTKTCPTCKDVKPLSEFYIAKKTGQPHSSCKPCAKAIVQAWRRTPAGREAYLKRQLARRKDDPIKVLWWNARQRAKNRNLEFTIKYEDIVVPATCPVLGIPLVFGDKNASANSPSVDRLDQSKGYTPDNIHVISWRANRLKSDATIDEMTAVLRYMTECKS